MTSCVAFRRRGVFQSLIENRFPTDFSLEGVLGGCFSSDPTAPSLGGLGAETSRGIKRKRDKGKFEKLLLPNYGRILFKFRIFYSFYYFTVWLWLFTVSASSRLITFNKCSSFTVICLGILQG